MSGAPDFQRVISIAGADPLLLSGAGLHVSVGALNSIDTAVAIRNYAGVLVALAPDPNGWTTPVAFQVANVTKGVYSQMQTLPPPGSSDIGFIRPRLMYFPVPFSTGDLPRVYYQGVTGIDSFVDIGVLGLSTPLQGFTLRPDGRLPPLGSRFAFNAGGAAPQTLILAPGVGGRILLQRVYIESGQSTVNPGIVTIQGTMNGATVNLLLCFSTTSAPGFAEADFGPNGLLLDANTAVTLPAVSNSPPNNVHAVYDVVA